jgi:hypothetical protein
MANELIGKRVMIVGKHPHKDEVGVIKAFEKTSIGYGLKIKFDNGEECYVFHSENLRLL